MNYNSPSSIRCKRSEIVMLTCVIRICVIVNYKEAWQFIEFIYCTAECFSCRIAAFYIFVNLNCMTQLTIVKV